MNEIDIKTYAALLLLLRLISMTLLLLVIKRQWDLFKISVPKNINRFRVVLFTLTIGIFLGNIIPAGVDVLTVVADMSGRPDGVSLISLLYSLDNSLTALLSAYLIWRLYRLAANEKEITDFTEKRLSDTLASKRSK